MSGPAYLPSPHDHPIWQELADELDRAMTKFGPMASPHEGWAVIREELEPELWEHVVGNTGRSPEARQEALQVAAMAIRYILDLCEPAAEGERGCSFHPGRDVPGCHQCWMVNHHVHDARYVGCPGCLALRPPRVR